jgi:putative MATE family efflux protein
MENNIKEQAIDTYNLGTAPIGKLLARMSAPMVLAMIANGSYYLADAAFVGIGVGTYALGALAVVFPLQLFAIALGTLLGTGAASIVSLDMGRKNFTQVTRTIKNGLLLSLILGIILTVILFLFKDRILVWMGASESILPHAEGYYNYIIFGFVFILITFFEINVIRGLGNAKLAGTGMITSALLNAALDPLFIMVFDMGTAGAAIATLVARIIVGIWLSVYLFSGKSSANLSSEGWALHKDILYKMIYLGAGAFLNQLSFTLLALVMNISLAYYGTPLDLSVYGVISRIYVFITTPLLGLAMGFQTVASYNYGAGEYRRVAEAVRKTIIVSVIIGIVLFLPMILFPGWTMGLFTGDVATVESGILPLRIVAMMTPIVGIQIVTYFFFMAIHQPGKSLFIAISRQVTFIIPLIVILPLFLGKTGIWAAYPVADILSVLAAAWLLLKAGKHLN